MREASKICQNWVNGLTWNGASLTTITLDCIMILEILDYILRTLADKIVK